MNKKKFPGILANLGWCEWVSSFKFTLFVPGLLFAVMSSAQNVDFTRQHYELPQINSQAVIDGVMDEPHWSQALKIELTYETTPDENVPAAQKTIAYIYEDGASLYVAFRAEDTEIEKLRAYLRDRDAGFDDDFVGIQFDTFNDEQRAYEFFVNPYGAQMDLLFDESTNNEDDSWDAIWSSAGKIDAEGYTVEMAIPFSNLRFETGDREKTWAFEVLRVHPRDQRTIYRNSPRDRNKNCVLCQWHRFSGLSNAKQGNQLELNPVLTVANSETRNSAGQMESNGTDYEPGLNLKWGITPSLTLDATINPDFSQVESDSPQLSVNETFALFFDERRPFFQEGADFFNSNLNAIYTRNVTDPRYGLKLTGRAGKHTFGTFAARDEITNIIIPGTFGSDFAQLADESDVLAGRYRYDFTKNLNAGSILTYRDAGDYNNLVVGVDSRFNYNNRHEFAVQFLRSETDNSAELQSDFDLEQKQSGNAFRFSYDYDTRNWFQYVAYNNFDKDFRADLGFITQVNNDKFVVGGGRVLYKEDAWWNRIEIGGDWDITHDNDGNVLEREIEARIEVNGLKQSYFNINLVQRDRLFDDILFDEKFISSYSQFTPIRGLLLEARFVLGDRVDFSSSRLGDNFRFEPGIHYSINKHTQLFLHHTLDRIDVDDLKTRTANLTDLRLIYQFSPRSFLRLTAQLQIIRNESQAIADFGAVTRDRDFNKQLLYSYKVNPRTVFFLGYSDLADSNDERTSYQVQERGLFMKLGYVFDY